MTWRSFFPATKSDIDKLMAKLSELNGRLTVIETKLDVLLANDPELPADAEATLQRLEVKLGIATQPPTP